MIGIFNSIYLILISIIALIIAILLLVSLHELGHLLVARLFNVKVKRFSIGFGKPIFRKNFKDIEWVIAPIPLGGYVSMLDSTQEEVSNEDLPYAFDRKHPLKKILIVLAGPLTNLLLAIILFFIIASFGIKEIKPIIGSVEYGSIAQKIGIETGDHIIKINNKDINNFDDITLNLIFDLEAKKDFTIYALKSNKKIAKYTLKANLLEKEINSLINNRNMDIGIRPYKFSKKISNIIKGSPAYLSGLKVGDVIVKIDNEAIDDINIFIDKIRKFPDTIFQLDYLRDNKIYHTKIKTSKKLDNNTNKIVGKVGILFNDIDEKWMDLITYNKKLSILENVSYSVNNAIKYTKLIFVFLGRLVVGKSSYKNIGGPLTIANLAGKTLNIGIIAYLHFLALLSINLWVINVLPIIPLDGGHILNYTIELFTGKIIQKKIHSIILKFGIILIFLLIVISICNDFNYFIG